MSYNSLLGLGNSTEDASLEILLPMLETTGTTANDASSNGNDGTIGGMGANPTTRTGPNSYLSTAFDFDGVNDVVTVTSLGDAIDGTEWTIGMRVYLDTYGESLGGRLFELSSSNTSIRTPSDEKIWFAHEGNQFNTGVDVVDASWHSFIFEKASTTKSVFIDGTEYSESDTGSTTTTSENINFGNTAATNRTMDGAMCEVFLFSRILTGAEQTEIDDGPESVNTVAPGVTGTEIVGSTLTCSSGTWGLPSPYSAGTNGTITYSYQWTRSNDGVGTGEANISGATSATYTLVSADVGKYLRCLVAATNDGGTSTDEDTYAAFTGAIANSGSAWYYRQQQQVLCS
jgi:hypothetical protein